MHTKLTEMFGTEYSIFAFSHCRDVVAACDIVFELASATGDSVERLNKIVGL